MFNIKSLFKLFIFNIHNFQSSVAALAIGGSVASLASGAMQAGAASDAADAQSASAAAASKQQREMYDQTRQDLMPYMKNGEYMGNALKTMLDNGTLGGTFNASDLSSGLAPNYHFQLQQGQQALQNSQAASNGAMSGAAMKDMQNFTQNTAASAYQNAYNNWQSTQNLRYGQLMGMTQLGQNAAAMVGNNGQATAQGIANNTIGSGNAQAAGLMSRAQSIGGGINNASAYLQQGMGGGFSSMFGGGGGGSSLSDLGGSYYSPVGTSSGAGFSNTGMFGSNAF